MSTPIHRINPTLKLIKRNRFDSIIDVRSPSEFLDDHLPNAINLPVLSDLQRETIGTIYTQSNPFEAKRAGAALVAQNISHYLQTELAEKDRNWQPLIYCWRGGHRSGAMARVFSDIGWHTRVIEGGYKAYRKKIQNDLNNLILDTEFIVITGPTGIGKTDLLAEIKQAGQQVLDLEALACHRGSILGAEPKQNQPSQKFQKEMPITNIKF